MTAITVITGYLIPDVIGGGIASSHNSSGSYADNSFVDGSPPNGTIGIDGSNNQLCVRINGAWYGVALTALTNVFEIDAITVSEVVTVLNTGPLSISAIDAITVSEVVTVSVA